MKRAILVLALVFTGCANRQAGESGNRQAAESGNRQAAESGNLFMQMEKLAQQGNPEAQYHLGMFYNNGLGTEKNPQKAFEWFERATRAGDPLAAYKVGCYYDGQFKDVVPVDLNKAVQYKLVAANAGYSLAQGDVANAFYKKGNFTEAIKWWKAAGEQGHPKALYNLSVSYNEGKGVPKDKAFTYAYFKLAKLASENQISKNAQATLDELAKTMSTQELAKAEKLVSQWKTNPTPLTIKASDGIDEAKRLVAKSSA